MKTFVFAYKSLGKYYQTEIDAYSMNEAIIKFGKLYHIVDEIEYAQEQIK